MQALMDEMIDDSYESESGVSASDPGWPVTSARALVREQVRRFTSVEIPTRLNATTTSRPRPPSMTPSQDSELMAPQDNPENPTKIHEYDDNDWSDVDSEYLAATSEDSSDGSSPEPVIRPRASVGSTDRPARPGSGGEAGTAQQRVVLPNPVSDSPQRIALFLERFLELALLPVVTKPLSWAQARWFQAAAERLADAYMANPCIETLYHFLALPKLGLMLCKTLCCWSLRKATPWLLRGLLRSHK